MSKSQSQSKYPSNLIIDNSDSVSAMFPEYARRLYYCAKASTIERNIGLHTTKQKNIHPTVKPVSLMRYLCRLVTPRKGKVLDPFMGSGTTGIGARLEGFNFIDIEKERSYFKIAKERILSWRKFKQV